MKIRIRRSTRTGNCQFSAPWCRSLAGTFTMLSITLIIAFVAMFMANPPDTYLQGISSDSPAFWLGTSGPANFDWQTLTGSEEDGF